MTFENLNLIEPILRALREEGYETPTPIQTQAIPHALQGRDILGCAQTGTGKTAAFAIPILQLLQGKNNPGQQPKKIKALVLTPTRELAIQIEDSFNAYGRHVQLRNLVIFGGVSQNKQVQNLQKGVAILVATPGRLLDLMNQGFVSLQHIELFVLDEADRMLDMGFIQDVKRVIKALPERRQTLFFSATMPPEIASLAHNILRDPVKVAVTPVSSTVEAIGQSVYFVEKRMKIKLLIHLWEKGGMSSALVFTRTKHGANRVVKDLVKTGIKALAIHGNKSQTARQNALSSFKNGGIQMLIATDIAARGIDIDDLSHVINFDLPNIPETYVHRIGRTGRAGASGIAISFCDSEEKAYLKDIQKLIKQDVPVVHEYPFAGKSTSDDRPAVNTLRQKQQRQHPQPSTQGNNRPPRRSSNDNRQPPRPEKTQDRNQSPPQRKAGNPAPEVPSFKKMPIEKQCKQTEDNKEWSSIFEKPANAKRGFVIKSDRYENDHKKRNNRGRGRGRRR